MNTPATPATTFWATLPPSSPAKLANLDIVRFYFGDDHRTGRHSVSRLNGCDRLWIWRRMRTRLPTCLSMGFGAFSWQIVSRGTMADRSLKLLSKNRLTIGVSLVVSVCHDSIFGRRSVCQSFLRSRAAPTRPKSEKPRKSREGKRSKRLKRQQQERKEKYRKRQCRANHEQHNELSKLSATHDVQRQRSGKKFHGGASHTAPNPTPRKGVTSIMLRIRLRRYRDALGKNNSAAHLVQSSSASRFTAGAANSR
jgi:hypothetical protein